MRRIGLLLTTAIAFAAAATAQAATSSPPRGELSKTEYREFVALQKAEKRKPTSRDVVVIARQVCKPLTNVSRVTTTQHAECEASLLYSVEFAAYPYAVEECHKLSTTEQSACLLDVTNSFEKTVRAFIGTNAASVRATNPRHFSRHCLNYLVFTRDQAQATHRLLAGLKHYASAVKSGSSAAITGANTRIDSDLVGSKQAMSLDITVSACRHQ